MAIPSEEWCREMATRSVAAWKRSLQMGCLSKGLNEKARLYSHLRHLSSNKIWESPLFDKQHLSPDGEEGVLESEAEVLDPPEPLPSSAPATSPVMIEDLSQAPSATSGQEPLFLTHEEFFNLLESDKWAEGCSVRVLGGKLLTLLLAALHRLEKTGHVTSHYLYANLANRRPVSSNLEEILAPKEAAPPNDKDPATNAETTNMAAEQAKGKLDDVSGKVKGETEVGAKKSESKSREEFPDVHELAESGEVEVQELEKPILKLPEKKWDYETISVTTAIYEKTDPSKMLQQNQQAANTQRERRERDRLGSTTDPEKQDAASMGTRVLRPPVAVREYNVDMLKLPTSANTTARQKILQLEIELGELRAKAAAEQAVDGKGKSKEKEKEPKKDKEKEEQKEGKEKGGKVKAGGPIDEADVEWIAEDPFLVLEGSKDKKQDEKQEDAILGEVPLPGLGSLSGTKKKTSKMSITSRRSSMGRKHSFVKKKGAGSKGGRRSSSKLSVTASAMKTIEAVAEDGGSELNDDEKKGGTEENGKEKKGTEGKVKDELGKDKKDTGEKENGGTDKGHKGKEGPDADQKEKKGKDEVVKGGTDGGEEIERKKGDFKRLELSNKELAVSGLYLPNEDNKIAVQERLVEKNRVRKKELAKQSAENNRKSLETKNIDVDARFKHLSEKKEKSERIARAPKVEKKAKGGGSKLPPVDDAWADWRKDDENVEMGYALDNDLERKVQKSLIEQQQGLRGPANGSNNDKGKNKNKDKEKDKGPKLRQENQNSSYSSPIKDSKKVKNILEKSVFLNSTNHNENRQWTVNESERSNIGLNILFEVENHFCAGWKDSHRKSVGNNAKLNNNSSGSNGAKQNSTNTESKNRSLVTAKRSQNTLPSRVPIYSHRSVVNARKGLARMPMSCKGYIQFEADLNWSANDNISRNTSRTSVADGEKEGGKGRDPAAPPDARTYFRDLEKDLKCRCIECECFECVNQKELLCDCLPETKASSFTYPLNLGRMRRDYNFLKKKGEQFKPNLNRPVISPFQILDVSGVSDKMLRFINEFTVKKETVTSSTGRTFVTLTFTRPGVFPGIVWLKDKLGKCELNALEKSKSRERSVVPEETDE